MPECPNVKNLKKENGGLDQFGAGPFEQQQFGTADIERLVTRWSRKFKFGTEESGARAAILRSRCQGRLCKSQAEMCCVFSH